MTACSISAVIDCPGLLEVVAQSAPFQGERNGGVVGFS
jgi:hypothetical protein